MSPKADNFRRHFKEEQTQEKTHYKSGTKISLLLLSFYMQEVVRINLLTIDWQTSFNHNTTAKAFINHKRCLTKKTRLSLNRLSRH